MHYGLDVLSFDGRTIGLKFVESIKFPDDQTRVVDKLKDDCSMEIIMISGNEYTVSMKAVSLTIGWMNFKFAGGLELRTAIYDRWKFLLGK